MDYYYQVERAYDRYVQYATAPVLNHPASRSVVGEYVCFRRLIDADANLYWVYTTPEDFFDNYEAMFNGKSVCSGFYRTNVIRYGSAEETIEVLDSLYEFLKEEQGAILAQPYNHPTPPDELVSAVGVISLVPEHVPIIVSTRDQNACTALQMTTHVGRAISCPQDFDNLSEGKEFEVTPVYLRTTNENMRLSHVPQIVVGDNIMTNLPRIDYGSQIRTDYCEFLWTPASLEHFERTTGISLLPTIVARVPFVTVTEDRGNSTYSRWKEEDQIPHVYESIDLRDEKCIVPLSCPVAQAVFGPAIERMRPDSKPVALIDLRNVMSRFEDVGDVYAVRLKMDTPMSDILVATVDPVPNIIVQDSEGSNYLMKIKWVEINSDVYVSLWRGAIKRRMSHCIKDYALVVDNPYWRMRHECDARIGPSIRAKLRSDYELQIRCELNKENVKCCLYIAIVSRNDAAMLSPWQLVRVCQ